MENCEEKYSVNYDKFSRNYLNQELKEYLIKTGGWKQECPIDLERLQLLNLSYYDFAGIEHNDGQIIIFDVLAQKALNIFQTLYDNKFPINKIKLIHHYNYSDLKSMEDNNSSAFNCRKIKDSNKFSLHSYGMAIDINPLQNPFIDNTDLIIEPPEGKNFLDRSNLRPGMVENKLANGYRVIDIFKNNKFSIWGGDWNFPIDYHHFQVTRDDAIKLAAMSFEDGINYIKHLE